MTRVRLSALLIIPLVLGSVAMAQPIRTARADDPNIQYFGRWDLRDPLHPRFSWPGVSLRTEFTGTSIGVRLDDPTNYYNVFIDGRPSLVFHGTHRGETVYPLVHGLPDGRHTLRLSRRNITFDEVYTFCGVTLDSGATLLPPPPKPARKIEFIGDSFTAAESNEATAPELPWEARFPVTNIDKGFAPLIAGHFGAQYTTTCRSGSGLVCDWQGNRDQSIPARFDRTLMDTALPKWDFARWQPEVVIVCLGLNDYSGLKEKDGTVTDEHSGLFRSTYHTFLGTLRAVYPGVTIVAVAAFPRWIRENVSRVVDEEHAAGNGDVFYATFDEFPRGYVANGHPTVATHRRMADQIIAVMESNHIFEQEP
jgi:hypothetical protein